MASACDHDHDAPGLSGHDLAAEMTAVETRCVELDQRLTAPRRRAMEMLLRAGHPVKAYDLIAGFGEDGGPAKPPTVYRALDFLEKHGFAHRIASLGAFVACRRGVPNHAAAFLICDCCGAAEEVEPALAAPIKAAAAASGYALKSVTVEARGLCAECQKGG
jgi:Fur family transcriptional regulator, zinc uptake regulator